jgi:hypothetical protein
MRGQAKIRNFCYAVELERYGLNKETALLE